MVHTIMIGQNIQGTQPSVQWVWPMSLGSQCIRSRATWPKSKASLTNKGGEVPSQGLHRHLHRLCTLW